MLNLRKVFQRSRESSLKLNSEKCELIQAYCATPGDNHQPLEAENRTGMADPEEQTRNSKLPGPIHVYSLYMSRFANIAKPLTKLMEEK
jgi:hypothetical protein